MYWISKVWMKSYIFWLGIVVVSNLFFLFFWLQCFKTLLTHFTAWNNFFEMQITWNFLLLLVNVLSFSFLSMHLTSCVLYKFGYIDDFVNSRPLRKKYLCWMLEVLNVRRSTKFYHCSILVRCLRTKLWEFGQWCACVWR